jgi:hypothetical protein
MWHVKGNRRSPYSVLVGRPEGKRPLGTAWRKWEDNIKMNLKEVQWAGMDRIDLA